MKFSKKNLFLFSIVSLITFTSYSQTFIQSYQNVVNQCSQNNITTNLTQFESLGVKRKGTPALQNTLNWIENKYLSYGYTASQLVEDTYSYSGYTCKNLVVTKVGTLYPNTYLIVCGHYDSIVGTGTNDNGSGTVAILEVARLLQNIPTEYSIKFIHFSGEEDGLYGSQHYVDNVVNGANPVDIRLVFNLDEVGGVAGLTNDTITCERDTGNPSSNNAASNAKTQELINCVELYTPLNTLLASAYASDYMTFENNNEIITGFFETNETTHRHSATDFLVNMDPVYNYNVAKAAIGATMHFAIANTSTLQNETIENDFQVSFFPNPANDFLTINKGILTNENYTFSIIDIHGKTVVTQNFENTSLLEKINVSQLSSGIYLGVLEANGNRITKKIVVE